VASVLITGVGRSNGIAAACARALAADGWDLGLHSFDEEIGHLLPELRAAEVRVATHRADLGTGAGVSETWNELSRAVGPFSALVLLHDHCDRGGLRDIDLEAFDLHFHVNVLAAVRLIQRFGADLREESGRIVAFTSDALDGEVAYGASKAALERVVLAAARELAPQGVSANCINPGPTDTGWMTREVEAEVRRRTPLGRPGLPGDAAALVRFLLSPEGGWLSGQVLNCNGGFA
jgi:3-oxoacyl-[acyl-carrier protein] reductase